MSRKRKVVDRSVTTDIVTQLECAFRNPHAALIGAVIGGLVPWFGRTLAHDQIPTAWSTSHSSRALIMLAVVIGCAVFSGLSVYKFGKAAFGDHRKALGFVLALEGVMLVATGMTSVVALLVLILINAVANGSVIALARDATKRRAEADARRAATRRAGTRTAATPPRIPYTPKAAPKKKTGQPWHQDVTDAEIVSEQRYLA
jgi:Na+-transporting methylmalonyl-CoA/oxaloacetate decarboxylase gamma subunit